MGLGNSTATARAVICTARLVTRPRQQRDSRVHSHSYLQPSLRCFSGLLMRGSQRRRSRTVHADTDVFFADPLCGRPTIGYANVSRGQCGACWDGTRSRRNGEQIDALLSTSFPSPLFLEHGTRPSPRLKSSGARASLQCCITPRVFSVFRSIQRRQYSPGQGHTWYGRFCRHVIHAAGRGASTMS